MFPDQYYKTYHQKISSFLNDSTVPKFMTQKWIEVNNSSSGLTITKNNRILKIPMLRSDLCDYSGSYIVVKGRITLSDTNIDNIRNKS